MQILPLLSLHNPTLPVLHHKSPLASLSHSQFNLLRKKYNKSKANAQTIEQSPYYTNRHHQHPHVYLPISSKNYLTKEIEQYIVKKITSQSEHPQEQHMLQTLIKSVIKYCHREHQISFEARTVGQYILKLKLELAKIEFCSEGHYYKSLMIIGFESDEEDQNVDYLLAMTDMLITTPKLRIRPLFQRGIDSIRGITLADFKFIRCLGSGGFSLVYLVRAYFNGKLYAMKLISKYLIVPSQRDCILENYRYILGTLDSPFTTTLHFCFESISYFVFVIECMSLSYADCSGGELFYQLKKVRRMEESYAKFYFLEILIALDYLHGKGIVYRDLKPYNLLIAEDGHIKIADFGLSKPLNDRKKTYSLCGSPEYMAPEMLSRYHLSLHSSGHDFTLDYYCLGALLYELVIGMPPHYSLDQYQLYDGILSNPVMFPSGLELSDEIYDLLEKLLDKDVNRRLGRLYGAKYILRHPWIGNISKQFIEYKRLHPPFIPSKQYFNFDSKDIQYSSDSKGKIANDTVQLDFECHFNEQFTFIDHRYMPKVVLNRSSIIIKTKHLSKLTKHRGSCSLNRNNSVMNRKNSRNIRSIFMERELGKSYRKNNKENVNSLIRSIHKRYSITKRQSKNERISEKVKKLSNKGIQLDRSSH